MCDTFVHIPADKSRSVIFGKNSDREPNEAQQIVRYPKNTRKSSTVKTTFIEVEHPNEIYEVILSKPFQMWGAEMGVNEYGVAIGNEAVFTNVPFDKKIKGLTGMDLIRISLEISKNAKDALNNIIYYLEKYGQDACGGYTDKNFYYHNSFIVADKNEAYVLETAGSHWVYLKVIGYRAISNGLSIEEEYDGISKNAIAFAHQKGWIKKREIFNFNKAYSQWLMPKLAACEYRRGQSEKAGNSIVNFSVKDAFSILRSHGAKTPSPSREGWGEAFDPSNSKTNSICMHASGLFTPHQSVGSMVVELRKEKPPTIWLTGTSNPCLSIFKPFYFGNDLLNEENFMPPSSICDQSYWWQWEKLHRDIIRNYAEKEPLLKRERFNLENTLMDQDKKMMRENTASDKLFQLSKQALVESNVLLKMWSVKTNAVEKKNKFLYDVFWKRQNRKAEIPACL